MDGLLPDIGILPTSTRYGQLDKAAHTAVLLETVAQSQETRARAHEIGHTKRGSDPDSHEPERLLEFVTDAGNADRDDEGVVRSTRSAESEDVVGYVSLSG